MMELYASCRQVRTPLRRLCLGVLEKLPLVRDRFFAGLLTVGADRPWELYGFWAPRPDRICQAGPPRRLRAPG
jgi:hypothetical protein